MVQSARYELIVSTRPPDATVHNITSANNRSIVNGVLSTMCCARTQVGVETTDPKEPWPSFPMYRAPTGATRYKGATMVRCGRQLGCTLLDPLVAEFDHDEVFEGLEEDEHA